MENLMPKKMKTHAKPKTKRLARVVRTVAKRPKAQASRATRKEIATVQSELRAHIDKLPIKQRKQMMTDALEAMVVNAPLKQRVELAEHIADIGIELLGFVYGVDTQHALVSFPDDSISRLVLAIDAHESTTQIPADETIERLIASLNTERPEPLFN